MDKTPQSASAGDDFAHDRHHAASRRAKPRASFFAVSARLLVAVAILAGAWFAANQMIASRPEPVERRAFERSFTVTAVDAQPVTVRPSITAFGEVLASRAVDIRAQVGGQIQSVSPNLLPGGEVETGEELVTVDRFDYESTLADAEAGLAQARLGLVESREALSREQVNLELAQTQLDAAEADLQRAETLLEGGSITEQALQESRLIVAQRRQAVRQSQSAVATQETAIERQQSAIRTAQLVAERAQRSLDNTTITAPFDGVVVSANAAMGGAVTTNEVIGRIYDRDALEVRFTLSDDEYGRLTRDGLIGRTIEARWDIEPDPVVLTGAITRTGAEIDAATGGVTVFASLEGEADAGIRPGTFVAISVEGPALEGVLRLPEMAVYDNDHVFIIVDGALQSVPATVVARDAGQVLIRADIEPGTRIATTRLAQAGDGVKVRVEGDEPQFGREGGPGRPGAEGGDAGEGSEASDGGNATTNSTGDRASRRPQNNNAGSVRGGTRAMTGSSGGPGRRG
ncbi:efflux RND transporter periplasmic adaptor subunit [Cucumibacter marinus]|uniref:efflux RND transporter periplasmic adaptor subunit n=1 Tax=Cucumibacter marinus TaxID=1121252 RepID=UPI0003FABC3B|nr:efflux RND transporter periplasmic adaptor subunit [Cucumibacter marinus]